MIEIVSMIEMMSEHDGNVGNGNGEPDENSELDRNGEHDENGNGEQDGMMSMIEMV